MQTPWPEGRVIRWGIVGCGDVTEFKSGPAFANLQGSSLVAVMRRDVEKARDYARRHGVPFWTGHVDELIDHPCVDAVYVATPPGAHADVARRVAAAGKPCYVEKPLGRCAEEARGVVNAFDFTGSADRLFVAYYRRRLPRFVEAKRIIRAGKVGRPQSIDYRLTRPATPVGGWRTHVPTSGGGLFVDLGSHLLDWIDDLFGPVRVADAHVTGTPGEAETAVRMTFEAGGVSGRGSWDFAAPGVGREDRLTVRGEMGSLSLSLLGNEPIRLTREGETVEVHRPNPPHVQRPLIERVLASLRGVGDCPASGEAAVRTWDVMDRVLHDWYGGRTVGFWDPSQRRGRGA